MNTNNSEIKSDKNNTINKQLEMTENDSNDSPSSSSFLMQLQKKLKTGLQPTTTKFVQKDGTVNFFKNHGTEILVDQQDSCKQQQYGFVVDTKPDLSVGKILPWLYLSSQDVAQDVTLLKDLNITHILSLLPGFQLTESVTNLIKKHLVLEFYDEEMFTAEGRGNTLHVISQALDFISHVKTSSSSSSSTSNNNCNVLVHCNAGMSRAPTIVILYLMKRENMTFQDAFEKVKLARPITKPNDSFLKYLQSV